MQVSFQHVNPNAGHESTLLHITPNDQSTSSYLIDAGVDVSPHAFLGSDRSLSGVFLTHAHSDHYESLGRILEGGRTTPLYTSPATANVLEQIYGEAAQYRDLGEVDEITEAITPIETWTNIGDAVDVCPVPAGHTPGAVGFLFRIDDLQRNGETVLVLATGDFTPYPVAGNPGLELPEDVHVDVMIANAATTSDFGAVFSSALETILEQALGGGPTLVATGGLSGIHVAYVLGQLIEELGHNIPIVLVGQAAKLYTTLEYDVPSVTLRPQFKHTDEVLSQGAITIAGPATPTQGSTSRLFGVVSDDPSAAFIQLNASDGDVADGARCGTFDFPLAPHPSREQFLETVTEHLPRHLVLKHASLRQLKSIAESFEDFFYWTNDDMNEHILYNDGDWVAPDWMTGQHAHRVKQRTYHASDPRMPLDGDRDDWPTVSVQRTSIDLTAERVKVTDLKSKFPTSELTLHHSDGSTPDGHVETQSSEDDTAATLTNGGTDVSAPVLAQSDFEELHDRLDTLEAKLDDVEASVASDEAVTESRDTITTRLDYLDETVTELSDVVERSESPPITGTVVRQGELTLIRVDSESLDDLDQSLEHEQEIELRIETVLPK